ncbi:hypothetical protein [Cellulomonas sp. NPDC089187]|uniref:hypothetical protein n=1 Tax=Cellulomonas sp. NPDC089187 TaxID=3154970 RepID=UPI003424231A
MSASLTVPVIELRGVGETSAPGGEQPVAEELALSLHRMAGSTETWLYVGDGRHQALELSVGSWSRLIPALDRMVGRAHG